MAIRSSASAPCSSWVPRSFFSLLSRAISARASESADAACRASCALCRADASAATSCVRAPDSSSRNATRSASHSRRSWSKRACVLRASVCEAASWAESCLLDASRAKSGEGASSPVSRCEASEEMLPLPRPPRGEGHPHASASSAAAFELRDPAQPPSPPLPAPPLSPASDAPVTRPAPSAPAAAPQPRPRLSTTGGVADLANPCRRSTGPTLGSSTSAADCAAPAASADHPPASLWSKAASARAASICGAPAEPPLPRAELRCPTSEGQSRGARAPCASSHPDTSTEACRGTGLDASKHAPEHASM